MPFCPNPDCPHRKRHGEPAEFSKGVDVCSDCGSTLSETVPHFEPIQKPKTVMGWKCPECGSINREDMALCSCGFDSNRPFITAEQRARPPEAVKINVSEFGGPVELTKQERKFAEISAKKYHRFFYRNGQRIGWFGLILFMLGLFRIPPLSPWSHKLLVDVGTVMTASSVFTFAMTVVGKLYVNLKALEKNVCDKKGMTESKQQ
jgi:DNA-directed RNA polymerase subunit RPC12/RpoP